MYHQSIFFNWAESKMLDMWHLKNWVWYKQNFNAAVYLPKNYVFKSYTTVLLQLCWDGLHWHHHQSFIRDSSCFLSVNFLPTALTPFLTGSSAQLWLLLSSLHDWLNHNLSLAWPPYSDCPSHNILPCLCFAWLHVPYPLTAQPVSYTHLTLPTILLV